MVTNGKTCYECGNLINLKHDNSLIIRPKTGKKDTIVDNAMTKYRRNGE